MPASIRFKESLAFRTPHLLLPPPRSLTHSLSLAISPWCVLDNAASCTRIPSLSFRSFLTSLSLSLFRFLILFPPSTPIALESPCPAAAEQVSVYVQADRLIRSHPALKIVFIAASWDPWICGPHYEARLKRIAGEEGETLMDFHFQGLIFTVSALFSVTSSPPPLVSSPLLLSLLCHGHVTGLVLLPLALRGKLHLLYDY